MVGEVGKMAQWGRMLAVQAQGPEFKSPVPVCCVPVTLALVSSNSKIRELAGPPASLANMVYFGFSKRPCVKGGI